MRAEPGKEGSRQEMNWLTRECLSIPVDASSVTFLHTPSEFYDTLLERIREAKRRIKIASLYMGSGDLEKQLVRQLEEKMESAPDLQLGILLDYFRGTRGAEQSSASTLRTLAGKSEIRFFHTPEMRGMAKWLLPERLNELIGLQHMKFFIFDDSIIISGANLSDTYFTVRQDRYLIVERCPVLIEFFSTLFDIIASSSLRLESTGRLAFDGDPAMDPTTGDVKQFKDAVVAKLVALFSEFKSRLADKGDRDVAVCGGSRPDTFVCPFLQMGSFQIDQETELLTRLFSREDEDLDVTLSTAYFNLSEEYARLILECRRCPMTIIHPSPQACGFYNAYGLLGYVPSLYVLNASDFLHRAKETRCPVRLMEYQRPGWTFHSKGIWMEAKNKRAVATLVGSSNYGYRSIHRDLEAQVLLVTENEGLIQRVLEEKGAMMRYCGTVDLSTFLRPGYQVPRWMRMFSRFFRNYF